MPQNQSTNKLSAFIGITLLLLVLGFTVFINIPKKEKEKEFKPFTQSELDDLWELRGNQQHFTQKSFPINDFVSIHIIAITNHSTHQTGTIKFVTNKSNKNKLPKLFNSNIIEYNKDSSYIKRIEELYMHYQIYTITTEIEEGDFTSIDLRDGRKIFLIKEGAKIFSDYENELIEKANRINDSTRIILPLAIKEIRKKYFKTEEQIEEKERINLFSF